MYTSRNTITRMLCEAIRGEEGTSGLTGTICTYDIVIEVERRTKEYSFHEQTCYNFS